MDYHGIDIDYDKDQKLKPEAINMLKEFYAIDGEKSPQEMHARAAIAWSTYKGNTDWALAQRLYNYASNKWFMWASPVLSNAPDPATGKKRGLPISCFLGYVPDTVPGLIDHSTELRWLSVMGGGVGGHWADVRTASKKAPGPMPFIHTVDADMGAYKQGSNRRGSYAAYMGIDHPDILEFINMRVPTGDVNRKAFNLHNAVNLSDSFMAKVFSGENYELVDPAAGPTGNFLNARKVFEKLIEIRSRTGEPYLHFIDTANRALPQEQKDLGLKINGSNLCIEIELATAPDRTAVCCLSSPNLELYDEWKDSSMIADLLTMLDNVLEYFIENAPDAIWRAKNSAIRERAVGLGGMGWHNYLQMHSIPFESESALWMNEQISEHIYKQALAQNYKLGAERGVPSDMEGSGKRFSHMLAYAPNASSGFIVGTSPSGETNKANAYVHRTRAGSALVVNEHLKEVLRKLDKDTDAVWQDIITNNGSVQHLTFLPQHHKDVFKTSFEIDQHWVIKHAATRQKHVCQGQSVNVFFPAGAAKSYVLSVHLAAYKAGIKGLYYLRTESKQRAEKMSSSVSRITIQEDKHNTIYGKSNCPYCTMAKNLLDSKGIPYNYVDIEVEGKTAAEVTGRPDVRTVPQIYLDGEYVGGYKEAYEKLTKKGEEISDEECRACEG